MPRILGRHEMFPRVSNKPWLNYGGGGSGSSWSSATAASGSSSRTDSASSSTSLVRQRVSSTNLYALDPQQHRHEESTRRTEGLSYRIRDDHHTNPENSAPSSINTSADDWGYYVDFHSPQEERKLSFLPNNDEEILSLKPSPVEWALPGP